MNNILVQLFNKKKEHIEDISVSSPAEISYTKTFLELLRENGYFSNEMLCGTQGKCGRCKIQFLDLVPELSSAEKRTLSAAEQETGFRLACMHTLFSAQIMVPVKKNFSFIIESREKTASQDDVSLVIDFGTSIVHFLVVQNKTILLEGKAINPQSIYGSDVISRLSFVEKNAENYHILYEHTMRFLMELEEKVYKECGLQIAERVFSANSVLVAFLLQENLLGFTQAPYTLTFQSAKDYSFLYKGQSVFSPCYIPPCFSAFVGADIASGLAFLFDEYAEKESFIFLDMGTNGEFVLKNKNEFLITSVPLGPALEGAGLIAGALAECGVITRFSLSPKGIVAHRLGENIGENLENNNFMAKNYLENNPIKNDVIENAEKENRAIKNKEIGNKNTTKNYTAQKNISATGYISLLAILSRLQVINTEGHFVQDANNSSPLVQNIIKKISYTEGARLELEENLYLYAQDIEEFLKVKAAINVAFSKLCKHAELTADKITSFFLAGALGEHVDIEDLLTLGFLPPVAKEKIHKIGNSSLKGAYCIATKKDIREKIENFPIYPVELRLTEDKDFLSDYITRMQLYYVP